MAVGQGADVCDQLGRLSDLEVGSHWAAHDAPDLLIADLRQFFPRFR